MIVDGKQIAQDIIVQLVQERASLPPVVKLGFLMGEADAASASFVRIKERVAEQLQVVVMREEVQTTKQALTALARLLPAVAGIAVQLPMPKTVDLARVLGEIPPQKDIDFGTRAPVAMAVEEVLKRAGVDVQGKQAVVVGNGKLVGAPCAQLLQELGAEVTVITEGQPLEPLRHADIAVLGAGVPGLVKPEMLKPGVVLIDAGTSTDTASAKGRIAGDAEPRCAEVASVFTPVPGGIGPIAVAMLFKNLFALAKKA